MNEPDPLLDVRSHSFWQQNLPPSGSQPPDLTPFRSVDLCIVGAGIAGSSAAYLAAQAGLEAVVVDARAPALGASGRNAGMLLSGVADSYASAVDKYGREKTRALWHLSIKNRENLLALARTLNVVHDRCGSWLLADTSEEADKLAESARMLEEDGFPHQYQATDPLGRGFLAGIYRPDDAVTDPAQLSRAILNDSGAPLLAPVKVEKIEGRRDNRLSIVTSAGVIEARRILLTVNAYAPLLHPYFRSRIRPCRGQIQLSEPAPLIFPFAGYSHFGYWYFRQIPEPSDPTLGRWLIGGGRHRHFETENDHWVDEPSSPVQEDLSGYTRRYFPELARVRVAHRWAGTMGFTEDGLPLIGEIDGSPGLFYCLGFNGHGMGLAFEAARNAIELLTN